MISFERCKNLLLWAHPRKTLLVVAALVATAAAWIAFPGGPRACIVSGISGRFIFALIQNHFAGSTAAWYERARAAPARASPRNNASR